MVDSRDSVSKTLSERRSIIMINPLSRVNYTRVGEMRRKQTALLISFLILSSLAFVSQTRPQSPVSSTDPTLAEGTESPVTDQDGDLIPDLYEVIFGDELVVDSPLVEMSIAGLNPSDSTDNVTDLDRDGLTALQEYCWPYTIDMCFDERNSLTGKDPEDTASGMREYLDPRNSDTDGDGLPDGYEVHMCTEGGLFKTNPNDPLNPNNFWECRYFDPLDASDIFTDFDRCEADFSWGCGDGFDFNSDGLIDLGERFTNLEEYLFGSPSDWVTERDGLWCAGDISGLVNDSCQTEFERPTGDSGWLGTDPRYSDSDYYLWDALVPEEMDVLGDGIPDGWEFHHGLNPLNASDSIVDSDSDGWDLDGDGFLTPDISPWTAHWGESFSNIEEYSIDFDENTGVMAGLRGVKLIGQDGPILSFDHSTAISIVDPSIHSLISDQSRERLIIGSKYGITVLDPFRGYTSEFDFAPGFESYSMIRQYLGDSDFLLIGTNSGIHLVEMENGLPVMASIHSSEIGQVTDILPLKSYSDSLEMLLLGGSGAWRLVIDNDDDWSSNPMEIEKIESLSTMLEESNATAISSGHIEMPGRTPLVMIGTDSGLIAWNTTDGTESIGLPWWIFDQFSSEDYVSPNLLDSSKSASVNVIEVVTNPDGSNDVWLGTGGGLHLVDLDLIISQSKKAFQNERMLNLDGILTGSNNVHSIMQLDGMVVVGSQDGTWCLEGGPNGILGMYQNQTEIPGLVTSIVTIDSEGETWMFVGVSPGKYMNIAPMNPNSLDSDLDGMPDGWEFAYGLDPTDPFDAIRDLDADGVSIEWGGQIEYSRLWSNIDEYRFVSSSEGGHNGTDPRNLDSDGDGLTDGEEYWGWFIDSTNFDCHYLNGEYSCDEGIGISSREVHLGGWLGTGSGGGSDTPSDPTNPDSDGDGMPDGWEIRHRRWIGDVYTGGNEWTLDPGDPSDALEDADGDGLSNLCEFQWETRRSMVIEYGLESHGESPEFAKDWIPTDPNSIDSDLDSLPDGWEARYSCHWPAINSGINPMNGSDSLNNPDGDGFDANNDGILDISESYVNWFEYHIKSTVLLSNSTESGEKFPENISTVLAHESWSGSAGGPFGEFIGQYFESLSSGMPLDDIGSSDPLSSDSDRDGMPDGWEVFHARWDIFEQGWTLNPVNAGDGLGDPDFDGMSNWEEYNSIDSQISESDGTISSPQFYLTDAGLGALLETPWIGAESALSFGAFVSEDQAILTGRTGDPNNPDSDGDGLLDGVELIFTSWNSTDGVWTLNPLVPDDGNYDSDEDGISDLVELNITTNGPINGASSPPSAPFFWEESRQIDQTEFENRIYRILFSKEGRAELAMDQFLEWRSGGPTKPMLAAIIGITDPKDQDTDRDGMSDGYEYWFSEWNLESNHWSMNPLTDTDVDFDSDDDSYDCNGDGEISDAESFDNLAEYDSRWYGKRLEVGNMPNGSGPVSYGDDAVSAMIEEMQITEEAAWGELYSIFSSKSAKSFEKTGLINEFDPDNFNKTLSGISDPTNSDSDQDGMPDGWEYCYSVYGEVLPSNNLRWSLNPVNPLDVDYDPDADGWYDRQFWDSPAEQGKWESRQFTAYSQDLQIPIGTSELYFTNIMEYDNGTMPLDPDSDGDSVAMKPVFTDGVVSDYVMDLSLSDGLELFKYGTNPLDNDTDGDMMPDFYEHQRGWNETNDNWSSFMRIKVQWFEVTPGNWKPIDIKDGVITRPDLDWVWFTHDPTDPSDASHDSDNDGEWDCSGSVCEYVPYNNFQEFFAVVNATLSSPSIVRASTLYDCAGEDVEEWWQLRETLLGTCSGSNSLSTNYLRINRINDDDQLFALVINDNDLSYEDVNSSNDLIITNGAWTDQYNRLAGDMFHLPNPASGEYAYGWWYLDMDGDLIAEGTDPTNWDTDGDWLNDFFEIDDDLIDGIRGNSGSPIRYDDRTT